jgi:hypothetical protein
MYFVVNILKHALNDRLCHHKGGFNSVSGHFNYFGFIILTAWLLPRGPRGARWAITAAAAAVLARTYFGGYHSLRQVVLGAAVGAVSAAGHHLARGKVLVLAAFTALAILATLLWFGKFASLEDALVPIVSWAVIAVDLVRGSKRAETHRKK